MGKNMTNGFRFTESMPAMSIACALFFVLFALWLGEAWMMTISIVFLLAAPIPIE